MEDLRREFEGEPAKAAPTHEIKPPKRPEKLPISERAESPQRDETEISYRQVLLNAEARRSGTKLPSPESVDQPHILQRATQDRDDSDPPQPQRSRESDEEQRLIREMEHLRIQLREANTRADQAERVVEELSGQLKSRFTDMMMDNDNAGDSATALKAENKRLRVELDEARSHIFSLQPYRKDVTPKEVGQEFDDLVNGVTDWVADFIEPILDDEEKAEGVLAAARKRPADVQKLKRYVQSQGDLIHGSVFPETDIDVLVAVAMRFLQDHIFQKILFGAVPDTVEVLSTVEASMQNNVEPKRDLFALRSWRAEALNAVICSADYQRVRYGRTRELTAEMATLFKVFWKDKEWNKLCTSCQEKVIKPAVKLHEKLMTSTHHFYLDLNTYVIWNARQGLEVSPDFLDDLHKLKCENILQNRKPFSLAKLDPPPSLEQVCRDLMNVAAVVPALYMRQVGKGDVIKEPAVVRPQQVLVAWGPPEKRDKFVARGERTLVHQLCFPQRDRQEDGASHSWAPWRNMQWG